MGNYIFTTKALIEALQRDADDAPAPCTTWAVRSSPAHRARRGHLYDFGDNHVPGETSRDQGYWRDVGTLDAYHRPTWTDRRAAASTSTTAAGPSTPTPTSSRRPASTPAASPASPSSAAA
ncbi:hypothetical protein StrepF001_39765 [Streptomyces sp. F001]|nr:hypothetical protein StrepF001_39765 [Streptomyces sp. F001]